MNHYKFGLHKSPRDDRDYLVKTFLTFKKSVLPSEFDIRHKMTAVRNQGKEGACVGFAMVTGVKEYQEQVDYGKFVNLSPRFLYEEAKKVSGHEEGTTLKAAMQIAHKVGVCEEYIWPYTPNVVAFPGDGVWENALKFRIKSYVRITNLSELKRALFEIGPVLIGVKVYNGMVSEQARDTGIVPDPSCWDRMNSLGGHALCMTSFDDNFAYTSWEKKGGIMVKNSWGDDHGDKGYLYLSYEYIKKNMLDAFSSVDIDDPNPLTVGGLTRKEKRILWV